MTTSNKYVFIITSILLGACKPTTDSDLSSLEGAKKGTTVAASFSLRALDKGETHREAIDQIFNFGLPDGLMVFFQRDSRKVVNPGDHSPDKLEIHAKCHDIAKAALKSVYSDADVGRIEHLSESYREMDACWEQGSEENSPIVVHLVDDGPEHVHGHLPEILFLAFFEGVVDTLASAAESANSSVADLTLDAAETEHSKSVKLVNSVVAVRNEFALTALNELNTVDDGVLDRYQKKFGGSSQVSELAKNPIIKNFLLAELMAAYYGNFEENEKLKELLPETYEIARELANHFGLAYWQYIPNP